MENIHYFPQDQLWELYVLKKKLWRVMIPYILKGHKSKFVIDGFEGWKKKNFPVLIL